MYFSLISGAVLPLFFFNGVSLETFRKICLWNWSRRAILLHFCFKMEPLEASWTLLERPGASHEEELRPGANEPRAFHGSLTYRQENTVKNEVWTILWCRTLCFYVCFLTHVSKTSYFYAYFDAPSPKPRVFTHCGVHLPKTSCFYAFSCPGILKMYENTVFFRSFGDLEAKNLVKHIVNSRFLFPSLRGF